MPTFSVSCPNAECGAFGQTKDTILKSWKEPNPACPACRGATTRQPSCPAVIWTRPVGEYGRKDLEFYNPDGFFAYRVKSTRNVDGTPEKVWIDSVSKQREFARAEGLRMPDEMNSNAQISRDGKTFSTCGLPGQWSGLPSRMVENASGHEEGFI
jgi:hypothetical protein